MKLLLRFPNKTTRWILGVLLFYTCFVDGSKGDAPASGIALPPPSKGRIRIATFNVALNRKENGQLVRDLKAGDEQAKKIATTQGDCSQTC